MKYLIFLTLLFDIVFANVDTFIKFEAKIFPKIVLFDKDFKSKLIDNRVILNIIYCDENRKLAHLFKKNVFKKYGDKIKNYDLVLNLIEDVDLELDKKATGVVFLCDFKGIDEKIKFYNENRIITFGLDESFLEKGALISMYIGKRVKPFINKKIISEYKINFLFSFTKISKFYIKD